MGWDADWTAERGQALNHAVTDAAEIVQAVQAFAGKMAKTTRAESIAAYESAMMERAGEEVRSCDGNTKQLHDWAEALKSPVMRNGLSNENKVKISDT